MANTQYISVDEYKKVVSDYIFDKTKLNIRIVFDNPMNAHRHFAMLVMAYDYIQSLKTDIKQP